MQEEEARCYTSAAIVVSMRQNIEQGRFIFEDSQNKPITPKGNK
jgi:hypothetical protein